MNSVTITVGYCVWDKAKSNHRAYYQEDLIICNIHIRPADKYQQTAEKKTIQSRRIKKLVFRLLNQTECLKSKS